MNNIEQKIDEIVSKVLSEELNKKIDEVQSKVEEIDEMEDFYEIAKKRREEREMKKNMPEDGLVNSGDIGEEELEEGNEYTKARCDAGLKGEKTFKVGGKEHKLEGWSEEDEKSCKGVNESKKQKLQLTEDEMIELIERIVIQEKSSVESLEKKNSNETKKTNDDYVKSVTKKMKDYMKNMGVEYKPESESFPRGNTMMDITDKDGKVKNSDKKQMYTASDSVKQYVDQIAQSGGMENLDYDQIKPDESRLEKYIEGSSLTGNSDEYANAVKTDVNKNVNKRRKLNILAKLKKMSYQKAEQPVYDIAGNERHDDMMKSLDLASVEEKKKDKINENIEKMRNLINYNQKTQ